MTGVAFILFTFYMVTDPATTPSGKPGQVAFGAGVAVAYGLLLTVHVVFGLFFALTIVCAMRDVCGSTRRRRLGGPARDGLAVQTSPAAAVREPEFAQVVGEGD